MRTRWLLLNMLFVLAAGATASATTVIPLTLEKMARSSDVVLHGEVASVRVVAVDGNERHLRTVVEIRVHELLRGPEGLRTVTLELPGGKLGRWVLHIPGVPGFRAGEEVVLFLERTAKSYALTGLAQGKFSVYVDEQDGTRRVRRNLGDAHYAGFDSQGRFQSMARPADLSGERLDALLSEVRRFLRSAAPEAR